MAANQSRWIRIGLIVTVVFQLSFLGWEYLRSVWPLWFGTEVTLRIDPVDPRDLFRGDYVALNYTIAHFQRENPGRAYKPGDVAYIALKNTGTEQVVAGMYQDPPSNTPFIRGRVKEVIPMEHGRFGYTMHYGIEAYFLPREKAREADKKRNEVRYARVFILPNGRAAIADFR